MTLAKRTTYYTTDQACRMLQTSRQSFHTWRTAAKVEPDTRAHGGTRGPMLWTVTTLREIAKHAGRTVRPELA